MATIPPVKISHYNYDLPQHKIAQYPLEKRDESKLLVYHDGRIADDQFANLASHLPQGSCMVYNETRVVQARIEFYKETGALVEIFCLEPIHPTREIQQAFDVTHATSWKCLVGNSKKWKSGKLKHIFYLDGDHCTLEAERKQQQDAYSIVEFSWQPAHHRFSEVLSHAGLMPLPPYMKRDSEEADKQRYQTIYARHEGSVAAPTAGLHFTEKVFGALDKKGITRQEVTLHVGAGTFKPVTSGHIQGHVMHTEQIRVARQTIESLLHQKAGKIIAVGTTTLRTLESIYWHGIKILNRQQQEAVMDVHQWDPYTNVQGPGVGFQEAFEAVLEHMKKNDLQTLTGQTQLLIMPGYRIRVADILVTNFHLPQSTLLLLVSAFIGDDWKQVYQYALDHGYRFLSYGDSCLFFRQEPG